MIRYPKQMTLMINLDTEEPERINVPVLYIEYRERTSSYIEQNQLTVVTFLTEYRMSMDGFWKRAEAGFWIASISCLVLAFGATCIQFRRPSLSDDQGERCV